MLHESIPSLSNVHHQSVIEDSDENLTDNQHPLQTKRISKVSPPKQIPSKKPSNHIDSFTPVNHQDSSGYTKVHVTVGAEELTKSINRGGYLEKLEQK